MKTLFASVLAVVLLAPLMTKADGGFITEKFVWDKHKDINEPTQKAIIVYDAGREDLILQVKYEGPVDHFGWLIPVPNLPKVHEASMKCFYELSQYTQEHFGDDRGYAVVDSAGLDRHSQPPPQPPVKVVENKTVGAYDIAVLLPQDSGALKKWLGDNDFYLPPGKYDVVDSYIKRNWYFVAVKINLGGLFSSLRSVSGQLASGELNPLQLSFASDNCVFPLKISSINGKPSEVQVYVLSPEPLLEFGMLQKNLPLFYSNDMERAAQRLEWRKARTDELVRVCTARYGDVPPDVEQRQIVDAWSARPFPSQEELLPCTRVTNKDLPECCRVIPALGGKSWWLAKHTWTFQPEDMRDLTFEPAESVFKDMLGTKYGYFAATALCSFGPEGASVLVQAMQNSNPAVRTNAASAFNNLSNWANTEQIFSDPRVTNAAPAWLKDPEPAVRIAGLYMLTGPARRNVTFTGPLLALLQDPDPAVRASTVFDAGTSENDPISGDVLMALLQNSEAYARLSGVTILYRNANTQSVELALPLLKDPNPWVAAMAGSTLRALTGRDYADDQVDIWNMWWNENKANFAVRRRPMDFGFHPRDNSAFRLTPTQR